MWIKNNSNRSWMGYDCGKGNIVDVEPKAEFEVDNEIGLVLLKNLGADAWLVQIPFPSGEVKEVVKEEEKIEELEKEVDEQKEDIEEENKEEIKEDKAKGGFIKNFLK